MATAKFPLAVVLQAVDEVTGPVGKIQRRINKLMAPVRALRVRFAALSKAAGLDRIGRGLRNVGIRVRNLGSNVFSLAKRFALLSAAGAAAGVAILRSYAKAGDTIAKTARALGIGVEALQEYRFVAERLGVDQSLLDSSLTAFTKRLGEAKAGTGALVTLLRKTDTAFLEQLTSVESTEEAFELFIGRLGEIEDPMARAALAAAAFSRAGVRMVNLASEGAAGFQELREQARELGEVMSEDATKAAEEFADEERNLMGALRGVRNIIGRELLPVVTSLIRKFRDLVVQNQDRIRRFAREFAAGLPERLRQLKEGTLEVISALRKMFRPVIDLANKLGPAKTVVVALALALTVSLAPAVAAVTKAVFALNVALLKTPVGWAILGGALAVANIAPLQKRLDPSGRLGGPLLGLGRAPQLVPGPQAQAVFDAHKLSAEVQASNLEWLKRVHLNQAQVRVSFENAPRGTRVESRAGPGLDLTTAVGFALEGGS